MIDSATIKGVVRKTVAAITGFMLAVVLLAALLLTGFYLLVQASITALAPLLGEAGSMAVVGAACVLILVLFFWQMTRPVSASKRAKGPKSSPASSLTALRTLIQENPLESALAAFALGLAEEGDPRLRSLLLKGGMELMKQSELEPSAGAARPRQTPGSDQVG
ncbi:hypothetical protein [Marinobacter arenosus]|uniref:hypothetical protein n=1 Tax=Marinobacter arenosus TaxID=2856822 RepID=UPI001C4BA447|nr:hypothetical protein [Marinobacter arenosus]MBW0147134.1 hypothetical protein [Marinobacter arenosus]